jgi:hypothetical protein
LDNQIVRGTSVSLASIVETKAAGYAGVMGAYQVFRNNTADAAVPTTISVVAANGRFSDILIENNGITDLNLGPTLTDPLDFDSLLLRGNHANLNGNLSSYKPQKVAGIVLVP